MRLLALILFGLVALSSQARAACPTVPYVFFPPALEQWMVNADFDAVTGCATPQAADNAALMAANTTSYPSGIWRLDFSAGFGADPLFYRPSGSACSLNAGLGDNGSQVPSADGKCWLGVFPYHLRSD